MVDYEYAFFQLPDSLAAITGAPSSRETADLIEELLDGLERYEGGGWEIVSHAVFPANGEAMVSFLVRRSRGSQEAEQP